MLKVRQIGDAQLHTPSSNADLTQSHLLQSYITILHEVNNLYGGVGIACNQCVGISNPIRLFLVGVDDQTARIAAQARYPNETIPNITIMLNPKIVSYSQETYYPLYGEGCLSVLGPLRGKVQRYSSIQVQYQTLEGNIIERQATGFEAHIIQHEYDHLQGIVYLQRIFEDCTLSQKDLIITLLNKEINSRKNDASDNRSGTNKPVLIFDRQGKQVVFDPILLSSLLTQLDHSTLLGIKQCLQSPC